MKKKKDCENCEYLIKRYGYCPVVEDWVREAENKFSFRNNDI